MSSNDTRVRTLLAVLLAIAAVAAAVPMGASGQAGERQAELAVDQPHYVEGSVATTTANGTTVYQVQGEQQQLKPRNFNASQVVDFGVTESSASLAYNSPLGIYEFTPEQTGTYTLFWLVSERVNGSVEQHRYVARVRVTGGLDQTHVPESSVAGVRQDAQKWREFNASIDDLQERNLLLASGDQTNAETIQAAINAYILVNDPLAALTGNFTGTVLLLTTTPGGWLVLLLLLGSSAFSIGQLTKRLNRFEVLESEEGAIAEEVEAIERRETEQSLQDAAITAITADDQMAAGMRDLGETPLEQITDARATALLPSVIMRDRLAVMGASGYVAVPSDGDGAGYEVVRGDATDVPEDQHRELTGVDEAVLDGLDWDSETIRTFEMTDADPPADRLDGLDAPEDVDDINRRLDVELREFEDKTVPARYLAELVQHVREHPVTDSEGRPDSARELLEHLLQTLEKAENRYGYPVAQYELDYLRRAIREYDVASEAGAFVDDVRSGRFPGGGESGAD